MALFVCEACGCIENTALSNFWRRKRPRVAGVKSDGRALCSDCDPSIGKWHGKFPRRMYIPGVDQVQFKDGEWVAATGGD